MDTKEIFATVSKNFVMLALLATFFASAQAVPAPKADLNSTRQVSVRQQWCNLELEKHSVHLPRAVINAIMDTDRGRLVRKQFQEAGLPLNVAELFEGASVNVSESGDLVYLVGGSGPMTGADNRSFWLVRKSGVKAEVLLHDGTGCFYVDQKSTQGYKDIETMWASASTTIVRTYRYNGSFYKLVKENIHQSQ